MSDLDKFLEEQLKDPKFEKAYNDLEEEYNLTCTMIQARLDANLTQKELAERSGLRQSNISRIETMSCDPRFTTLKAIAKGLGKKLVIRFE